MSNTQDLSKFGYSQLAIAGKLLTKYAEDPNVLDGDNVAIEFNPYSGHVFLVDEDYNVAMMNGDILEGWYSCPYCGHEGFLDDMEHSPKDKACTEYLIDIKAIKKDETED